MRVSGRGWKQCTCTGRHRPPTSAAAVPRGNSVRRNRASKPYQLSSAFPSCYKGGQSQGLLRPKAEARLRPEPMAGARDERPLLTRAAVQRCMPVGSIVNARRNCSRGTGGLSDGGSAQGARVAAGCTEREPARDLSRVRRGAVCAEAGAHSQEDVGTPALKMAKCICDLSVCSNGGDN